MFFRVDFFCESVEFVVGFNCMLLRVFFVLVYMVRFFILLLRFWICDSFIVGFVEVRGGIFNLEGFFEYKGEGYLRVVFEGVNVLELVVLSVFVFW